MLSFRRCLRRNKGLPDAGINQRTQLATGQIAVTQETIYVKAPSASFHYHSVIVTGRYERQIPKHAHGAETLSGDA